MRFQKGPKNEAEGGPRSLLGPWPNRRGTAGGFATQFSKTGPEIRTSNLQIGLYRPPPL